MIFIIIESSYSPRLSLFYCVVIIICHQNHTVHRISRKRGIIKIQKNMKDGLHKL